VQCLKRQVLFTTNGNYKAAAKAIGEMLDSLEQNGAEKLRRTRLNFIPKDDDAEGRFLWGQALKGAKTKKVAELASLDKERSGFGWENCLLVQKAAAAPLANRKYTWLGVPGMTSSKSGAMLVPLAQPGTIVPQVTIAEKERVVLSTDDLAETVIEDGKKVPAMKELAEDFVTPLFHYDRHQKLYKEPIHACAIVRMRACVCVCVRARVYVYVCVCVCVLVKHARACISQLACS
jgi:hypothetical protein